MLRSVTLDTSTLATASASGWAMGLATARAANSMVARVVNCMVMPIDLWVRLEEMVRLVSALVVVPIGVSRLLIVEEIVSFM